MGTNEELIKEVTTRLDALGEQVSEARIKGIVEGLLGDKEFTRKMKFGASPDALTGSKFARFGLEAADVEMLYDLVKDSKRGPSEHLRNAFRDISDANYLSADQVRALNLKELEGEFDRVPKSALFGKSRETAFADAVRAMDTAESGFGSQLVGAQYVGSLWEAARPASRVLNLLDSFEMTAPTVYMPVEVGIPEMLYVSESTAYNSSNYTTSKTSSQRVSVSAAKFVIHQMWSGEMEEDSILPFVPFLRRQAQLSIAHYSDSLILNGDTETGATGNVNLDDAAPAATKHYLAFFGIRHLCISDNTNNLSSAAGAGVTADLFNGAYGRMIDGTYLHDWGNPISPDDVVHVVDPWTKNKALLMDEVITVDKLGRDATILSGQIGQVFGHPIVSSIALSKTEADGKVSTTGTNNIYGQIVTFNRRGLKWGWRRRVKVEVERIPATDQNRIVYSLRAGLGLYTPTGAASGTEWADVVYYIGL